MENVKKLPATSAAGLSGTALKGTALFFMLLDHIHYMFAFTGAIPEVFGMVGRLSADLFLFCLIEGFTHTHDRKKYFFRVMIVSAGMGLVRFFMQWGGLFNRPDGFYPANAIMTNFVILMVLWQGMDWLGQKRWLRGLTAVLLPLVWPFIINILSMLITTPPMPTVFGLLAYTLLPSIDMIGQDGGFNYILLGVVLYALRNHRKLQLSAYVVFKLLFDFVLTALQIQRMAPDFHWYQMFTTYYEWFGVFSVLFMLCYNGKRGSGHQKLFYIFYPAHIYLLFALSWGVYVMLN